jgi:RNA polymerase sigma-32 factor
MNHEHFEETHTGSTASLDLYFRSVQQTTPMSPEEEARIARKFRRTGDRGLADRLVRANLRFVVSMALKYRKYGFPLMDIIQEGNVGLLRAVERYDPAVGCRLISYGVWWIRACIQEYILKNWSLVRLGTTQRQRRLFNQLLSSQKRLQAVTEGGTRWHAAMGASNGATEDEVRDMERRIHGRDLSLDVPAFDGDVDGPSVMERLESGESQAEEEFAVAQRKHMSSVKVHDAMERLEARERRVIEMRHLAEEGSTLQTLAEEFGVSKERVRQLEVRALSKLRLALSRDSQVQELCAA